MAIPWQNSILGFGGGEVGLGKGCGVVYITEVALGLAPFLLLSATSSYHLTAGRLRGPHFT